MVSVFSNDRNIFMKNAVIIQQSLGDNFVNVYTFTHVNISFTYAENSISNNKLRCGPIKADKITA